MRHYHSTQAAAAAKIEIEFHSYIPPACKLSILSAVVCLLKIGGAVRLHSSSVDRHAPTRFRDASERYDSDNDAVMAFFKWADPTWNR
jgi:hypothetical protein